jgi:putative glycosyltransferase (TIGR04348 family)
LGRLPHLRSLANIVNIQLVTPAPLRINNGNRITALRWAALLKKLGHRVRIRQRYDERPCDALIALHAKRSAASIRRFHELHPQSPLILVLTGTDLYRDIRRDRKAQQSLELASRIVVLQEMALQELPRHLHAKTQVIYQSAELSSPRPLRGERRYRVCLIAHLRNEKDPLRAPMAARLLPPSSTIQLIHIGLSLDDRLGRRARAEAAHNPRYRWLGQLSHRSTRKHLAQSRLVCITSKMEGSSNVLSEALASGVPVIATRIPGLMGTLGKNFPGYFPVGNTKKLCALLLKAETDPAFYRALKQHCARAAKRVRPKREIDAWRRLLRKIRTSAEADFHHEDAKETKVS